PIRPGSDAQFLFAMANVLFAENLTSLGSLEDVVDGLDQVAAAVEAFSPESVEASTGIGADTIRRLARELAAADSAAVYGRIGTHTTEFGTLASWMTDVLNVITGNLDRPGGAMFPKSAHEQRRSRRRFEIGRWATRVNRKPEVRGELPVSEMANEILGSDPDRIRAMVTIAGNPILSTPDSVRLDEALSSLDFMVAVDIYLNETTRHADVILPGTTPLRRPHYDFAFYGLAVRNIANFSPALYDLPEGTPDEWEILLRLGSTLTGQGPRPDIDSLDDAVFAMSLGSAVADPFSVIHGRDPEEIMAMSRADRGPTRMLDHLLRTGPYGDGYGANPDGLSLEKLEQAPHGIDLGPLQPRLPADLCTPSGKVELARDELLADVDRLRTASMAPSDGDLVLIGRRDVRSNNSWMHNVDVLVRGKERCTLQINPADAAHIGVLAGGRVKISSASGLLVAPVEITDDIMRGVVSLPHGWGHDMEGSELSVASHSAGVNSNVLATGETDPLSGNAKLNGISVEVVPA
ncbi:MAG: molybdopterin dinucleotide binding domain-containing protein, partial [Acidimicrobiia bacterium]